MWTCCVCRGEAVCVQLVWEGFHEVGRAGQTQEVPHGGEEPHVSLLRAEIHPQGPPHQAHKEAPLEVPPHPAQSDFFHSASLISTLQSISPFRQSLFSFHRFPQSISICSLMSNSLLVVLLDSCYFFLFSKIYFPNISFSLHSAKVECSKAFHCGLLCVRQMFLVQNHIRAFPTKKIATEKFDVLAMLTKKSSKLWLKRSCWTSGRVFEGLQTAQSRVKVARKIKLGF